VISGLALGGCGKSNPAAHVSPTTTTPAPSASSPTPSAGCAETQGWNTQAVATTTQMTQSALNQVVAGQHECYDRVVFNIAGPGEVGIVVKYVPLVNADPSDKPLPVAGNAVLQVVVRAPAQGDEASGHPGAALANTGDYLYNAAQLASWSSLRAVRFAGSFEGQCTFAIGVRDQLPFRAFTMLDNTQKIRQVVVDVAHS